MNTLEAYQELRRNCILSLYAPEANGYCRVSVGGKKQFHHRLAYAAFYGVTIKDLKGKVIMHKCDIRNCINPEHLVAGTTQDNVDDKVAKGRSVTGETNGRAKLTEPDVIYIRAATDKPTWQLASMFGISDSIVRKIKLNQIWKHI